MKIKSAVIVSGVISIFTLTLVTFQQEKKEQIVDLSIYPIADYDAKLPDDKTERELRQIENKRFDRETWVESNPHPDTDAIGKYGEDPLPNAIPDEESDLILTGRIVESRAFMSNNKQGVYSEYEVEPIEIIKSDVRRPENSKRKIRIDRAGGWVRYPNGRKVLYIDLRSDLPKVGKEYLLFLSNDGKGVNYKLITGYEISSDNLVPLDSLSGLSSIKDKKIGEIKDIVRNRDPVTQNRRRNSHSSFCF
ncbi:MAG: hypothetical protein ACK5NT_15300 [Pyrinomonadaceae bacterium]